MATSTGLNNKTVIIEPGVHVHSLSGIYNPLGVGRVQKVKDSQCKVEFNPSVFSRPPFRSQNYILRLDEIEVCPTPLELARGGKWDEVAKFDFRQKALRFPDDELKAIQESLAETGKSRRGAKGSADSTDDSE